MNILGAAIRSAIVFVGMVSYWQLRLRRDRLGAAYIVGGATYTIFRETEHIITSGEPEVLVIGFRLKLISSNRLLHWLFQRMCILTTPFWCGLPGFKTKLWMVNPYAKNYLGIYDWRGAQQSQNYLAYLLPILRFFSVKGSVWARTVYATSFEDYLLLHVANQM